MSGSLDEAGFSSTASASRANFKTSSAGFIAGLAPEMGPARRLSGGRVLSRFEVEDVEHRTEQADDGESSKRASPPWRSRRSNGKLPGLQR